MEKTDGKYQAYVRILHEELVPAMGCTEPVSLAYAAALARKTLGTCPEEVTLQVSGCIIKNVKSVTIPNTGHMKGLAAAAAAGIVAGDPGRELEVIAHISGDQIPDIRAYLEKTPIKVEHVENGPALDITVIVRGGGEEAKVRIAGTHTHVALVEKNGSILKEEKFHDAEDGGVSGDRALLNMEDIWDFAMTADLQDVSALLDRQIAYNTAIADEGLRGDYGANIGKVLLSGGADDVSTRAKAKAAAGSDARMNGCELPVVINSGSGNQGITCCVPVVEFAQELGSTKEQLYRALLISNLVSIHQKTGIGTLSAYCGAVTAGAGAGAGIAYLSGGDYQDMIHTVVNSLAVISGIICDGAKASCAAKIAASVDAALFGYHMYRHGQEFRGGDGIVKKGVEATIRSVGILGSRGMKETNEEILRIMVDDQT